MPPKRSWRPATRNHPATAHPPLSSDPFTNAEWAKIAQCVAQQPAATLESTADSRRYLRQHLETLEILGDKQLIAALRRGIRQAKEGKTIPWEQVKEELRLNRKRRARQRRR